VSRMRATPENTIKQISASRLTRIALVPAGLGMACGQQQKTAMAAVAPSKAPAATGAAAQSKGVKQFQIVDPMIHKTALSGTVPANWSFDGMLLVAPGCNGLNTPPPPIWRSVSPDGITAVRQLAPIPWAWSVAGTSDKIPGCFPIAQPLTAYEFSYGGAIPYG
jgi:hypothetical protein